MDLKNPLEIGEERKLNGLLAVTAAIKFNSKHQLFAPKMGKPWDDEFQGAEIRLLKFMKAILEENGDNTSIVNIFELANLLNLKCEKTNSCSHVLPYASSSPLDFNDINMDAGANKLLEHRNNLISNTPENLNEFMILPPKEKSNDLIDFSVAYNLLLLLGISRSRIFSKDLALRVYNIALPPGRLIPTKMDRPDVWRNRVQSEVSEYIVVPLVTLYRKRGRPYFRTTFSLSIMLIPTSQKFTSKRSISAHEIMHTVNIHSAANFSLEGALLDFLGKNYSGGTVNDVLTKISEKILQGTIHSKNGSKQRERENLALKETLDQITTSIEITEVVCDPSITIEDVENAYKKNPPIFEGPLREELKGLATPEFYLVDDDSKRQSPDTVDFSELDVAEKCKVIVSPTFYNPYERRNLAIMPKTHEVFPNYSIKWAFIWEFFMSQGLSSVRTMIHEFYRELESRRSLRSLLNVENELMEDLDEFYDLDYKSDSYKEMYTKMKEIGSIEKDYQMLKEKLNSLKTNINVFDQRMLTSVLIFFAGFSTFTAVASLFPSYQFLLIVTGLLSSNMLALATYYSNKLESIFLKTKKQLAV